MIKADKENDHPNSTGGRLDGDAPRKTWGEAILVYTNPKVLTLLFLGFSAGLPFLLVFSTLSAWLRDAEVSRATIGYFSWVGITYSIKFFWAPVIDRLSLPVLSAWLGRRRSWMLVAQVGIGLGLLGMSLTNPNTDLVNIALLALLVAFSSATQDITVDAFRIESGDKTLQGAMSATYIFGYRLALLVAGAGALWAADVYSWSVAYQFMALLVLVGVVTTLLTKEPVSQYQAESLREPAVDAFLERSQGVLPPLLQKLGAWFIGAVACPFIDFFRRNGVLAIWILVFIGIYRLSDITMGVMANPFYIDMGYTKTEIAQVSKFFGFFFAIFGSALGGVLVVRFGVMRPLLWGAIMVASTNLLFALLAIGLGGQAETQGLESVSQSLSPLLMHFEEYRLTILAVVIGADNLSGGIAGTAFIAYLSGLTNLKYTATQYALFSSLMTLPGKFIGGFSGVVVDDYGYTVFFTYAASVGLPAIMLVIWLMSQHRPQDNEKVESDDEPAEVRS